MRCLTLFAFITFGYKTAICSPHSKTHIVHEKRSADHGHWQKRSRAPLRNIIPLRIGLKERNLHLGPQYLDDVSNPASPNYGKHWTPKSVADAFSPAEESVETVGLWLRMAGIERSRYSLSPGGNWIYLEAKVEEVETLLQTEYFIFEHALTSEAHIGCSEYSIPRDVQAHIDLITPTIGLMPNRNTIRKRDMTKDMNHIERDQKPTNKPPPVDAKSCFGSITPDCIKCIVPPHRSASDANLCISSISNPAREDCSSW